MERRLRVIRHVYLWQNGMVMVFDQNDQQMGDYQGRLDEVKEKILRDAGPETEFHGGAWMRGITPFSREEFAREIADGQSR
jgi:hypothetical protein